MMKIDIYSHIMPEKYLLAFRCKANQVAENREAKNPANEDLGMRL